MFISRVVVAVVFISRRVRLLPASLTEPDPFSLHSSPSLDTDVVLFFFFVLLKNIGELANEACAREHYLALVVNKIPCGLYFITRARRTQPCAQILSPTLGTRLRL